VTNPASSGSAQYIAQWTRVTQPLSNAPNVWLVEEQSETRSSIFPSLCDSVKVHLIGSETLQKLNYNLSAAAIQGRIPIGKRIRSGDLAEIIATDYVDDTGPFSVPLKRLRYKDDREMSMRGDDMIGLDLNQTPTRVLKVEVKSRANLSDSAVADACASLDKNEGRPKPASLAFTSMRLRDEGKDALAEVVERLQEDDIESSRLTHMVFTFSANDPTRVLEPHALGSGAVADRRFVGMTVPDHQSLIEKVFEALSA
jgi:hypothetical protein